MDDVLGTLVAIVLFVLAIVLVGIGIFISWLNRKSGQERRTIVHAEASAIQEDYAKAVTRATLAFSEQKRDANFAGIVICQKCGRAIPRSSGICGSCGTQVNQG